MIYKINKYGDSLIQEIINEAIKELEGFYEIKLDREISVVVVDSRKMIDDFWGRKSEPWLVAWAAKNIIYILDRTNFEKESDHSYSDEKYKALLKHEISHIYYQKLLGGKYSSIGFWFSEGAAIYSSGQLKFKKQPTKFSKFLNFREKGEGVVYQESGFVVDLLIKKQGKEKLLEFIKSLKNIKTEEEFNINFEKTFGFKLNYDNLNKLFIAL